MKCPFCGKDSNQVLESRVVEDGKAVRRRRICDKCEKRFTTYERIRDSVVWVVKKDGRREAFDANKLRRGIQRATDKRPVSIEDIERIIDQVEREALRSKKEEVSSKFIGRAVLKKLKKIDKVAWLRFASVYLEFKDLEDFEKVINK